MDFERLTELASLICEVPISLIKLIDQERQFFKSSTGLNMSQTSGEFSFCRYAIMNSWLFTVEDALKDEPFMYLYDA